MNEKGRKGTPFLIAAAAGIVLSVAIALLRGMGGGKTAAENAGILSDGFFITGVLMAGVGALLAISAKTDFFDMLSYGVKSLVVMFTPFRNPAKHPRFYEYKLQRQQNRKPAKMFLLFAGLLMIAAAAVCLIFAV